jgi:hypothetical protein
MFEKFPHEEQPAKPEKQALNGTNKRQHQKVD